MEYFTKVVSNFKDYYNGINAATLTGAIDVVIVQQEDGSFLSSPFHVRFGKLGVLRSREKIVDIEINGDPVDIHMKLGESGEAFFVTDTLVGDEEIPAHLATSPIPPLEPLSETDGTLMGQRDEGILSSSSTTGDIIIGPMPEGVTVFKAETVESGQVEGTFKPILLAENEEVLVEEKQLTAAEEAGLSEDDRKKTNRRRRKRRSLIKKKCLKNLDNTEDVEDVETTTTEESMPNTPRKETVLDIEGIRGHRKSHSVTVIDFGQSDSSNPSVSDDWFNAPMSRSLGPGFHFFSDTEADMEGRGDSRPPSPVHSDTEYEVGLQRKTESEDSDNTTRQSWRWGELPSPPVNLTPATKTPSRNISRDHSPSSGFVAQNESSEPGDKEEGERKNQAERNAETAQQEEAKRSMLSHMFSFMRQTKKMRNQAATSGEGIYLDDLDLNDLDPELAALYFPKTSLKPTQSGSTSLPGHRDDDAESGRGPSLPHSPHSMTTGATGSGTKSGPRSVDSDFEDSRGGFHELRTFPDVCMSLCGSINDMPDPPDELFLQSLVSYDDFMENPRIVDSPDLVVRIGNKYYNWQTACPIIMSWALYQRPLSQNAVDVLSQDYMAKRNLQPQQDKKKTDQQQQQQPAQRSSYSWFSWGKREPKKPQDPPQEGSSLSSSLDATTEPAKNQVPEPSNPPPSPAVVETKQDLTASSTSSDNESVTITETVKKLPMNRRSFYENTDKYRKTLRLSSEDIIKLNLRDGPNEAVFSVTTAYQGTTRCKCHIYLWKYDDRIVISDIDGTITKSDVLGHILPIVGKDWAQSGVAQLFTKIKNNGYRILYLSARAIGQARITRDYLRSVRQGDLCLPDGPLLLNPTSLLSAFHREVIEKKPEEFKISCLRDIQALFPAHTNPFYAGYGNKVNDVWAYRAVGIPISRIFTINHRGELKHELTQTFQSSYASHSEMVDDLFPPCTWPTLKRTTPIAIAYPAGWLKLL